MDLWMWVAAIAIAVALILLIDSILQYAVAFRRRRPVGGVLLEKYLAQRGGRLPAGEAVAMLEPVIRRLALFHTNGRVHLDLCPQRIVVVPKTGKAELLAPKAKGLRPGYAAPEQYGGRPGPRTDVYAVAAVFCRIVSGMNPPDAQRRLVDDSELMQTVAGMDAPEGIKKALLRALSPDPEKRFQDCGMLTQELYSVKPPAEQVYLKKDRVL